MYQYTISADKELANELLRAAGERNMSIEKFIIEILNKYLVPGHKIDHEAMAKGYEEMGDINLELAK